MKMKTKTAQSSAPPVNNEEADAMEDTSLLRLPVTTAKIGFLEAHLAYDSGTDEVRQLLANECDIVYECKCCRNMFRSLTNFISHKRVYCTQMSSQSRFNHLHNGGSTFCQDVTTVVQAEQDFITTVRNGRGHVKDLNSIVDRLAKREKINRLMQLGDFYEQVTSKLTEEEVLKKNHALHLDRVPDTNVAVYQTFGEAGAQPLADTMKTEMLEVRQLAEEKSAVLDEDGNVISTTEMQQIPDRHRVANKYECEICNLKFGTEKTLKLHIRMKHILSTYVFQCPVCSRRFLGVGSVIRHLGTDHKKSMRRVRLFRDSIQRRRMRMDEIQEKGPSRELTRLQTDRERIEAENKAWFDSLENEDGNMCVLCGKKFDRKAVLTSHLKVCQQKKKTSSRSLRTTKAGTSDFEAADESMASAAVNGRKNGRITKVAIDSETAPIILPIVPIGSTNKRKRGRAMKYVPETSGPIESDDDRPLIVHKGTTAAEPKSKSRKLSNERCPRTRAPAIAGSHEEPVDESRPETPAGAPAEDARKTKKVSGRLSRSKGQLAPNQCEHCLKKFSNASNLRRHIGVSHAPEKFYCDLCAGDSVFRSRKVYDVVVHLRSVHSFHGDRRETLKLIKEDESGETPTNGHAAGPTDGNESSNSSASTSTTTLSGLHSGSNPINNNHISRRLGGSMNRRKDRHTEVLKDDAEMFFADEMDEFLMHGSNENSNVDGADMATFDATDADGDRKKSAKRKGRPKANAAKKTEAELSQSLSDKDGSESLPSRRPVRNRRIRVKKDFVYDLSTLIKNKNDSKEFLCEMPKIVVAEQPSNGLSSLDEPSHSSQSSAQADAQQREPPRPQVTASEAEEADEEEEADIEEDAEVDVEAIDEQVLNRLIEQMKADTKSDQSRINAIRSRSREPDKIRGSAAFMGQLAVGDKRAAFSKTLLSSSGYLYAAARVHQWPLLKRVPSLLRSKFFKTSKIQYERDASEDENGKRPSGSQQQSPKGKGSKRDRRNGHTRKVARTQPAAAATQSAEPAEVAASKPEIVRISTIIANRIQQLQLEAEQRANADASIEAAQGPEAVPSTSDAAAVEAAASRVAQDMPSTSASEATTLAPDADATSTEPDSQVVDSSTPPASPAPSPVLDAHAEQLAQDGPATPTHRESPAKAATTTSQSQQVSPESQSMASEPSPAIVPASSSASLPAPSPSPSTSSSSWSSSPLVEAAERGAASRRMTLLERLAENKTKKLHESLSRLSLVGSSDNESEEENSD